MTEAEATEMAFLKKRNLELAKELTELDHRRRWNITDTQDGFKVCRGNHESSYACEWEYFVPRDGLRTWLADFYKKWEGYQGTEDCMDEFAAMLRHHGLWSVTQ